MAVNLCKIESARPKDENPVIINPYDFLSVFDLPHHEKSRSLCQVPVVLDLALVQHGLSYITQNQDLKALVS